MVAMEPIIPNWIDIGNHLFVILINVVLLLNSRRIVALFKAGDDSNFELLPNTKLTKSIRAYLYQTPSCINRHVYEASVVQNLSLATPDLLAVAMES